MRKIVSKKLLIILIIISIVVVLILGVRGCSGKVNIVYDYDKVTIGSIKKTISVSGKLELYDRYIVKSKIKGVVNSYYVDFNDKVKKGKLLATIDSESTDNAIFSFTQTYKNVKLDLESSREYLKNKQNLYNENLISKKELDAAKISYKKALSNFKQSDLKYKNLLEKQKEKKVYSPVSGVVIQRWADLRKNVGNGTALFLISPTMTKMKLIINIDESDIGLVKAGQSVDFTVSAYPENTFTGIIKQVRMNPVQRGSIVTYESLVICDNKDELLRPGMTVTATVNIDKIDRALRVPNQAFVVSPIDKEIKAGKKYIWKKDKLSVSSIPMKQYEVEIGLVGDYFTEIKKVIKGTLKEGDEILIGTHKRLEVKDELSSYGK